MVHMECLPIASSPSLIGGTSNKPGEETACQLVAKGVSSTRTEVRVVAVVDINTNFIQLVSI